MKLSAEFVTDWPDELLREWAREVLKAARFSAGYLPALRYVLGNQAEADRRGAMLDQTVSAPFATPRTMRTINAQMLAAGIITQQRQSRGGRRVASTFIYCGQRPDDLEDEQGRQRPVRRAVNEEAVAFWRGLLEVEFAEELA